MMDHTMCCDAFQSLYEPTTFSERGNVGLTVDLLEGVITVRIF